MYPCVNVLVSLCCYGGIDRYVNYYFLLIFSPWAARDRRARGESPKEALQKWAKCDKESKP